jgi:protein Tex
MPRPSTPRPMTWRAASCGLRARPARLMGDRQRCASWTRAPSSTTTFGLPTVKDILAELEKPGRDPRPSFAPRPLPTGWRDRDLKPGMLLEGTVTNVAAFGAFVDIGVHQDGLVHVSQLADRFVKDPHEVVKAGDVVKVRVVEVDVARKRIGLTMRSGAQEPRDKPAPAPDRSRPGPKQAGPANAPAGNAFADALKGAFRRD